jgi:hypothetical protein
MLKFFALSATATGLLCAGCASYSERVVEKPVPATTTTARSTTYVTEPSATTTVYSSPSGTTSYTTTPTTTTTVYR